MDELDRSSLEIKVNMLTVFALSNIIIECI